MVEYLAPGVLPPLPPGLRYVEASASTNHTSALRSDGTVVPWGSTSGQWWQPVAPLPFGAGSLPTTRLVPRDTPRIGSTLEVTFFDLPADLGVLIFGWQRTVPLDLGFLGMPGCDLHVQPAATVMLVGQGGQAKWSLPIPNEGYFIGVPFYNQALVLDPSAGNGFGAVMSDAAEAVIGHW